MAAKHTEVERKYEVDDPGAADTVTTDHWLAAELGYVSGPRQTHQLDATYYDSEDLRLGAARVTLRRRTGGGDAGWHLKLPLTGDARTELHRPLGRSLDPPLTLTRLVRGVVGGRKLAPVATIRTRRTESPLVDDDGHVLAVVSRDEVTAHAADSADSPMHWVEIEVDGCIARRRREAGRVTC